MSPATRYSTTDDDWNPATGRHAFDEDAVLTPIFHALTRGGWRSRQHEPAAPAVPPLPPLPAPPRAPDPVDAFRRDPLTAPYPDSGSRARRHPRHAPLRRRVPRGAGGKTRAGRPGPAPPQARGRHLALVRSHRARSARRMAAAGEWPCMTAVTALLPERAGVRGQLPRRRDPALSNPRGPPPASRPFAARESPVLRLESRQSCPRAARPPRVARFRRESPGSGLWRAATAVRPDSNPCASDLSTSRLSCPQPSTVAPDRTPAAGSSSRVSHRCEYCRCMPAT